MSLLGGIRVLDFGRFIAGPYCAALLGDLGADVIRIERVEGGEDRYVPPVADTGEGGLYLQMNRNKRCLTLDLASADGRQHRAPAGGHGRRGGGQPAAVHLEATGPGLRHAFGC